ncbi:uncharacterized protein LOC124166558 [Ischnura elegans]|uniref:uncharacterized protein LOC124166558 n=1 Tax=Ischnura elegans TaxID=197161 RepID=UPI001ED8A026|nr:uncharacterized protein LOC124166558 [Ischnura elegans]XP_046400085.1 uncharacterized protein LOC124166558 [Ischnura elegans]XP_046400092.1 uncharacterized protein LOC124166558 [Ischnura elegans]
MDRTNRCPGQRMEQCRMDRLKEASRLLSMRRPLEIRQSLFRTYGALKSQIERSIEGEYVPTVEAMLTLMWDELQNGPSYECLRKLSHSAFRETLLWRLLDKVVAKIAHITRRECFLLQMESRVPPYVGSCPTNLEPSFSDPTCEICGVDYHAMGMRGSPVDYHSSPLKVCGETSRVQPNRSPGLINESSETLQSRPIGNSSVDYHASPPNECGQSSRVKQNRSSGRMDNSSETQQSRHIGDTSRTTADCLNYAYMHTPPMEIPETNRGPGQRMEPCGMDRINEASRLLSMRHPPEIRQILFRRYCKLKSQIERSIEGEYIPTVEAMLTFMWEELEHGPSYECLCKPPDFAFRETLLLKLLDKVVAKIAHFTRRERFLGQMECRVPPYMGSCPADLEPSLSAPTCEEFGADFRAMGMQGYPVDHHLSPPKVCGETSRCQPGHSSGLISEPLETKQTLPNGDSSPTMADCPNYVCTHTPPMEIPETNRVPGQRMEPRGMDRLKEALSLLSMRHPPEIRQILFQKYYKLKSQIERSIKGEYIPTVEVMLTLIWEEVQHGPAYEILRKLPDFAFRETLLWRYLQMVVAKIAHITRRECFLGQMECRVPHYVGLPDLKPSLSAPPCKKCGVDVHATGMRGSLVEYQSPQQKVCGEISRAQPNCSSGLVNESSETQQSRPIGDSSPPRADYSTYAYRHTPPMEIPETNRVPGQRMEPCGMDRINEASRLLSMRHPPEIRQILFRRYCKLKSQIERSVEGEYIPTVEVMLTVMWEELQHGPLFECLCKLPDFALRETLLWRLLDKVAAKIPHFTWRERFLGQMECRVPPYVGSCPPDLEASLSAPTCEKCDVGVHASGIQGSPVDYHSSPPKVGGETSRVQPDCPSGLINESSERKQTRPIGDSSPKKVDCPNYAYKRKLPKHNAPQ